MDNRPPTFNLQSPIKKSLIVCAIQRSGSSLLCEALKNTGLAGVPEEYFLCDENGPVWETGWWAQQHGVYNRRQFLDLVREKGTTANGVFGTKLMWNYFPMVIAGLQELAEFAQLPPHKLIELLLPDPYFIWIVRQDRVKQAISWSIATQTGDYGQPDPQPKPATQFDFEQIDLLHTLILEGEAGWRSFFEKNGIKPFKVTYESFVQSYEETAVKILNFAEIPSPKNLTFGKRKLKKQAGSLNQAWAERYRQMKQEKDA